MSADHVSFRPGAVLEALRARGPRPGTVARRDLTRYYALLQASLPNLTVTEARVIAGAWRKALLEVVDGDLPNLWHWLVAALEEALRFPDRVPWVPAGVTIDLIERARGFELVTVRALIDAVERYQHAIDTGATDDEQLLERVGLIAHGAT